MTQDKIVSMKVRESTRTSLNSIGKKGDSYDTIIKALIEEHIKG